MKRFLIVTILWAITSPVCLGGSSQVTVGQARFTIVTPNLVRMEYAGDGGFTDEPTLFAFDRASRFDGAAIAQKSSRVSIDTGAFILNYDSDGKPFNRDNLKVRIGNEKHAATWTPGLSDPLNLGGTLRTLDGCAGPRDLGMGLISRSGWALVDDSGTPVLTKDWVQSRSNKSETDWYLFAYGSDYKAALKSLAAISGPAPLPRKNLLGIWYSRYWPYTSADYRQIVREYSDHGFPLDNIVMDMDWHITQVPGATRGFAGQVWTGYTWDRKLIPDAETLLQWFHSQGLFVTLNDHPADGVQAHEQMYANFMRAMGADPTAGKIPFDAGNKKYLDTFYQYTHKPLEKMGVDFWWLDWQQYPNTRSVPDLSNLAWLNQYYFAQTGEGGKRGVSFSRWGGWGDQRHPIHFSGDANTGWNMLAFEVPFTSTAGNVGCFFWSHDIGGHMGGRNEESYTRWCQFGALSAALRSHSTRDATMDRRPWKYPEWAEQSMQKSFQLRAELMPYIYTSAAETCRETIPLLRPMYFVHPNIEAAYHNAQQYYFGDDLLVSPITTPGSGPTRLACQKVWFPPGSGSWFNYFTGERYESDSTLLVASDIDQFPLFFRGGVPIPMQSYTPRPTTVSLDHLVLRCYPGEDGQENTGSLYEDDGQTPAYSHGAFARTRFVYRRNGESIDIKISPTEGHYDGQVLQRSYTLELPCIQQPTEAIVDGDSQAISYDPATWTARLEIAARSVEQAITINVRAKIANPQTIHRQAIADRLSKIVGHQIEPGAPKRMVSDAIEATTDPSLGGAILAATGIGVIRTNDAPYLYNGHEAMRVFIAPGILDSGDAIATLQSAAVAGAATALVSVKLVDGSDLDIKSLSTLLPAEDSVIVPDRPPKLRLVTRIGGVACRIEVPAPMAISGDADLARLATATATSCEDGYSPAGAIDGIADGYPNNKRFEWSSNHEKVGAAITLTWSSDQTISRVMLFDRPNLDDQVLAGRLVFSDGDSRAFGELPNDGRTPVFVTFPPKTIRWMRLEITQVKPTTQNAGIAEIAVFR